MKKLVIINDQVLRLGYLDVDHNNCANGSWEAVCNYFIVAEKKNKFVASRHKNQIKQFYEEGEETLWITFYVNRLWWCFSRPQITMHSDKTKTRPVIGKWTDTNIYGKSLSSKEISGKLLKTQGFRGTICLVHEAKYVIDKINGEDTKEIEEVKIAMNTLKDKVSEIIKNLHWKDFELLIDLIFRQGGWKRISEIGSTQKTIDLELFAPVTNETAIVQIKAQAHLRDFDDYNQTFSKMNYNKYFFIVHSPFSDLLNYINETNTQIYFIDKIAELTIAAGLVDWLINKA